MERLARRTPVAATTEPPVLDEAAATQQLTAWANEQTGGRFTGEGPSLDTLARLAGGLRNLGSTSTAGSVENPGCDPDAQTPAA